ncbi:MAG: choice-of-anchor D domain-containing protein [Planctomycetes bacterium]|nr:choice-of-anchor D domain-containing protein [Planctomycetota bacterium]
MRALWIWLVGVVLAGGLAAQAQELLVFEGSATGTPITDNQAVGGLRDFGQVAPSTVSTPLNIYFTNNRSTPINFGAWFKTGANPADFYVNSASFTNPLPAGQTTSLTVTFYRTTSATCSATLNVPHDALGSGTSPFEINMGADCVGPHLQTTLGSPTGQVIVHAEPASGTGRDFGSWATIAGPSAAITISITNAGTGYLNLSTPDMAGVAWNEFVINSTGFSASLAAGQSTSIAVAFDPVSAGIKNAYLRIPHTDTTTPSPYYIPVTGNGLLVFAPVMNLALGAAAIADGGSRAVGSLPAGTATGLTFTISNTGNVDLNLTGTPAVQLLNTVNCTVLLAGAPGLTVIPPGTSTVFSIDVTPAVHAAWSFDLWIANDDPARVLFDVTVLGLGVVTPTELRVTTQPANAVALAYLFPAPVVAITDAAGLVRTDDNSTQVLVSITSGTGAPGAYLSGTLIVQASAGYVICPNLEIDRPGTYSLTFTDVTSSLGATSSGIFTITSATGSGSGGSGVSSESQSGCTLIAMPASPGLWLPALLLAAAALRGRRTRDS